MKLLELLIDRTLSAALALAALLVSTGSPVLLQWWLG